MDLSARVEHLEKDVGQIKIDVAVIKSNYATKEDVAKLESKIESIQSKIIMWVVGAMIASAGIQLGVVKLVMPTDGNQPKAVYITPAPSDQPTVLQPPPAQIAK